MKVLLIALTVILTIIARYFIKYKQFVKRSTELFESNRSEILNEIKQIGDTPSQSVLAYKYEKVDKEENVIVIPSDLESNWKGITLKIGIPSKLADGESENVVTVTSSSEIPEYTQIGFTRFYSIHAPRVKLKNGKSQNLYSTTRFIQKSKRLKEIYKDFKGRKKYEALEIPLASPIRIFGNPEWLQTPRHVNCPLCKEKMKFIAQVPGHYLSNKADKIFKHGNIYIFGCNEHTETFKSLIDIT